MAYDNAKYQAEFIRDNYDQIMVKIPKGKKELLKKTADKNDTSVNKLIIEAVEEKYKIDLSK